jgi:UDPglucose 6-dehydrogenase
MNIGIIGLGVVGSAVKKGFEFIGHSVVGHDIRLNTIIENVLNTEIVYICVGTPPKDDDSCDISSVLQVVGDLDRLEYNGIIVIKSTVTPGTTNSLLDKYSNRKIAFVPEFLRERCAYEDFVNNHNVLVVGTDDDVIYSKILESHGNLPKNFSKLSIIEAELVKYFSNTYKATKITFANSFHKVSNTLGADYTKIKDTFLLHGVTEGEYLDVNGEFGGFGGMCLPKDIKAMKSLINHLDLDLGIFDFVDSENKKFTKKVPKGMRE